ncbi:MAG: hypothetical protein EHM72_13925, partial [Calditrichaeota bacterium]
MLPNERSLDLYEQIPGYIQAAPIPIPEINTATIEKKLDLKLNRLTRLLVTMALYGTGFKSFSKNIPEKLEQLQRKVNLRGPMLFAPVVSATLALKDDSRIRSMIDRAITLALGAYDLYQAVWSAQLSPDYVKGDICEMGQYPNFFSTSITFENNRPRIFKSSKINQLTVIAANRIFILEITDWESTSIQSQLRSGLNRILEQVRVSQRQDEFHTPAMLTAANDITQYQGFREIIKNPLNAASLEALRHSFFTLCFDIDEMPKTYADAIYRAHRLNFANRWNHSSYQLVVFKNFKACAICNFSTYLDGNTMVHGIAEIQKRASTKIIDIPDRSIRATPAIKELGWNFEKSIVESAQNSIHSILDDQKATFTIRGIGEHFFKCHGCKAVPAFVIALQTAVKRLTGEIIPITQFLSISKYRCMDLTTCGVTTEEMQQFINYFDAVNFDNRALDLFHKAIQSQIKKMQDARKSMPIDDLISYYIQSRKKIKRLYVVICFGLLFRILRKAGALKSMRRNIV